MNKVQLLTLLRTGECGCQNLGSSNISQNTKEKIEEICLTPKLGVMVSIELLNLNNKAVQY